MQNLQILAYSYMTQSVIHVGKLVEINYCCLS